LINEWKKVIEQKLPLKEEYKYIDSNFPDKANEMKSLIWRNIQHYPVDEQIWWLTNKSNFKRFYKDKFEVINMTKAEGVKDVTDYIKLTKSMQNQLKQIYKNHPDADYIVNPTLASRETQVVWFGLANAGFLPSRTRFISTYDRKDKYPDKRYKLFDIKEIPTQYCRYNRQTN